MNTNIKTYLYNQTLNFSQVLSRFNKFKQDVLKEQPNIKYITLNIQLLNEQSILHLVDDLKLNLLAKHHDTLNAQVKRKIKLLKQYFKDQTVFFEEIQFTFESITYKEYISLDENKKLIKKMIKKRKKYNKKRI